MVNFKIDAPVDDPHILREGHIYRDGFVFVKGQKNPAVFNRILIRKPERAKVNERMRGFSSRTLDEHIALINKYKIEKAHIICDNLDFILECPSLNDVIIWPSLDAEDKFDYSVLYKMPLIKIIYCNTHYGDLEQNETSIDYSEIKGLEEISMSKTGHIGCETVQNLKKLWISDKKTIRDLSDLSCSDALQDVTFLGCGLRSLDGVEKHKMMKSLTLWHNYSLTDISALEYVADSLTELSIDACSKIKDFSVLKSLHGLEYLYLDGNNELPSLDFLEHMPGLKVFVFSMNVLDGDLSKCMNIPFVSCRNRKHYNIKDKDLQKKLVQTGENK